MIVVALVLAALAAALHVFIFYLESIAWTGPQAAKVFGHTDPAATSAQKALAFNQGFYNLFLAIVTAVGIVFVAAGQLPVGAALVFAGAGSMAAAALVLLLSSPDKSSAALKQGVLPALAIIALVIGLATA